MRPFEFAKLILGLLTVCAALLLASPGVRVAPAAADELVSTAEPGPRCSAGQPWRVRVASAAADELVSTAEPGPQCSAGQPPGADTEAAALIAQLRQEQMVRIAAGGHDPIVLNGRGYNYGPPPGIDLARIQAEGAQLSSH